MSTRPSNPSLARHADRAAAELRTLFRTVVEKYERGDDFADPGDSDISLPMMLIRLNHAESAASAAARLPAGMACQKLVDEVSAWKKKVGVGFYPS